MTRIPKRLKNAPLIEVVWQCLFDDQSLALPVGEAMVGILYRELGGSRAGWQLHKLPTAFIPQPLPGDDPYLRYVAKYRIESPSDPILYQLGDRVVSVHCRRPYVGWSTFRGKITHVQRVFVQAGLIPGPTKHGLRYIDLIRAEDMPDLSGLRLHVQLGDHLLATEPLHLRVTLSYGGYQHTLQILAPAEVELNQERLRGTLVDLETFASGSDDWSTLADELDPLHTASIAMFFEQVLTQALVEKLEPEY